MIAQNVIFWIRTHAEGINIVFHSLVVLTVPRGLLIFAIEAHSYRKSTEGWNLKVAKKSRQNGDACINGSQFKIESIET